MKLILTVFLLFPTLLFSQELYREATQEERQLLLKDNTEIKLKEVGTQLAQKSETSVIEKSLLQIAQDTGDLSDTNMKGYIQHLTNHNKNKEEVSASIENLGKRYFAELQLASLNEIVSPEIQQSYEERFKELEEQHKNGKLDQEQLDRELSKLDKIISDSSITKQNELKQKAFTDSFLKVFSENTFTQNIPDIDPKKFSSIKVMVPSDFSMTKSAQEGPLCLIQPPISDQMDLLNEQLKNLEGPKIHQVWFAWGYNRATHSNTDVEFRTKDGNFTIHDAVGKDRQSPAKLTYLRPDKLTIPQYNLELGVMFNEKWGMDFHMDHMKYVFDNSKAYEITGNYNHQVSTSSGMMSFSQAQANKDASWLNFEHTNGYNYASLGAVYNQKIFATKKKQFAIDARFGAGAGLMIPKTEVWIYQDSPGNRYGIDNKFHIAGGGVHGDARIKLTFWDSFFIQAATRATYIKVKDALVDGADARVEHIQPITSIQIMGQIGYQYTFDKKKKTSKKRSDRAE